MVRDTTVSKDWLLWLGLVLFSYVFQILSANCFINVRVFLSEFFYAICSKLSHGLMLDVHFPETYPIFDMLVFKRQHCKTKRKYYLSYLKIVVEK